MVIFVLESEFVFRTSYALFYLFVAIGTASLQPFAQFVDTWRGYKYADGIFSELLFHINATFDVDIQDNVMPFVYTILKFTAEGPIITPGIYLFILDERSFCNEVIELLVRKEVIIHAVDFSGARFSVCRRYRELQI